MAHIANAVCPHLQIRAQNLALKDFTLLFEIPHSITILAKD
ncbi:hypothetical protein [Helicobacter sp. MIT 05-5294]|nr:hypothetical protein [Helicobacter sp. MIT 05-5294]